MTLVLLPVTVCQLRQLSEDASRRVKLVVKVVGEEQEERNELTTVWTLEDGSGSAGFFFFKKQGSTEAVSLLRNKYYAVVGSVNVLSRTRGAPATGVHVDVEHWRELEDMNELTFHFLECIYVEAQRKHLLKKIK